jgi:hypothetical protein
MKTKTDNFKSKTINPSNTDTLLNWPDETYHTETRARGKRRGAVDHFGKAYGNIQRELHNPANREFFETNKPVVTLKDQLEAELQSIMDYKPKQRKPEETKYSGWMGNAAVFEKNPHWIGGSK